MVRVTDPLIDQLTKRLAGQQIEQFWEQGYLLVDRAVDSHQLAKLQDTVKSWTKDSLQHKNDYGQTLDGRARFDLGPLHRPDKAALRRVQSPEEISNEFLDVMRHARTLDFVADLIGPALRFHHGKVNCKLPGSGTKVKFHQDFTFQPMTNDDMITCLLFLDDVTLDNGPLEVVPGSHKGELYSLWHDGVFTGAVADEVYEEHKSNIVSCAGKAGSVCLMHSSLLHGSAENLTDRARSLYIATYYAEDAIELSPNALPSTYNHELVRGEASGRVRCSNYQMEIPEVPKGTSFFAQQTIKN